MIYHYLPTKNLVTVNDYLALPGVQAVVDDTELTRVTLYVDEEWILPYKKWFTEGDGSNRILIGLEVEVRRNVN